MSTLPKGFAHVVDTADRGRARGVQGWSFLPWDRTEMVGGAKGLHLKALSSDAWMASPRPRRFRDMRQGPASVQRWMWGTVQLCNAWDPRD